MLGMAAVDEAWQHCAHGLREVLHGRASRLVRLFSTALAPTSARTVHICSRTGP
jgi:hypothetical protein